MRRVNAFLIILIIAITALIASTALGFALFSQTQTPYNWMSQMWSGQTPTGTTNGGMGGMMSGTGTTTVTATNVLLPYFGVLFAILIGVTVVGVVGISYYVVYPQIRMSSAPQTGAVNISTSAVTTNGGAYESVTKTLTSEERKVIEVLNSHNGKYLQKYIKTETGLSRLKTHRILNRLSERGIVSLEKTGNTNQVYLASWLNQQA
jgi:predicted transcriptional regulator